MKPQDVDKLICGWSMSQIHHFSEDDLNSLVDLIAQDTEKENESIRESKRLIFEQNGRLLAEKEAGLWDANHPVREQLRVAVEALEEIKACGNEAHKAGTSESHSLNLGICIGTTIRALAKIRGEGK